MNPQTPFRAAAATALADQRLRATLKSAVAVFRGNRARGLALLPEAEFEALRDRAAEVRRRCLRSLPALLERLEHNVVALGGHVHWARTGAEANEIVASIAAAEGVRLAVKGKSMVTEETGLNAALEARGVEVVETDLGEWIVQLAGEKPSHIVAPAMHKDRREVSELFHAHLGEPLSDDIPELTLMARRALRAKFLAADMGITGANMAVAETGSVVLVENEGNIRMSTTLPRVHVAVMSIEKVVATLDDMADLLAVLPRSCTGQTLSSYTSVLSGPRRPGEADGARAFHLVLLDNGRSGIVADPAMRDVLACVRCGACINVCPVYAHVGGHSYGSAYCGPMGSLLAPLLARAQGAPGAVALAELPFACTTCGACAAVCPVRIDHPTLLLELRRRAAAAPDTAALAPLGPRAAAAFARLAARPGLWRAAAATARTLDPGLRLARCLPGVGAAIALWARSRRPPRLRRPFSARWGTLRRTLEDHHG